MPAASPTSIARRSHHTTTRDHAGTDRDRFRRPEVDDAGDLVEKGRDGFGRRHPIRLHAPGDANLHDADAGDDPADVARRETPIDEAVQPVGFSDVNARVLVLDAEQELAVSAKSEDVRDAGVGSVGPDDESRGAGIPKIESALRALRRDERRLVRLQRGRHILRVEAAMRFADPADLCEERGVAPLQRLQSVQVQLRDIHGPLRLCRSGDRPQQLHAGSGRGKDVVERNLGRRRRVGDESHACSGVLGSAGERRLNHSGELLSQIQNQLLRQFDVEHPVRQ